MLAITQAHQTFYYLHWVPSEDGPLITQFGHHTDPDFDIHSADSIINLLQEIQKEVPADPPIITFTLDADEVLFSETQISYDASPQEMLAWHAEQSLNPAFDEQYYSYHYPFDAETSKFLNIHIAKDIRKNFTRAMEFLKQELRILGIGIFSAELCARQCFQVSQTGSYAVWRMGRFNIDYVLKIQDGALACFGKFKRSPDEVKILDAFGDHNQIEVIRQELAGYQQGELNSFTFAERILAYQCADKSIDIKRLLEASIPQIELLNPLKKLKLDQPQKLTYHKLSHYAETGIAFRGIDV